MTRIGAAALAMLCAVSAGECGNWPRWRGPDGAAVSEERPLPERWSGNENIVWKTAMPGEGSSSPIVWGDHVFLTSALEDGTRRVVQCLDRGAGTVKWSAEIEDENPEVSSALTGHAASTPATDGSRVVAFFGNAGVVCCDFRGEQLWRRRFGEFDSELGLASSPVIDDDRVILVCDHDGSRFRSFDSFLIALDLATGETVWKTERPKLKRSWSTPIIVPVEDGRRELVVNAQDELRGYDPAGGALLWRVRGMTGWVTPSPVFGDGMIYATSGRDGPLTAVWPGGRGDVTETHVAWTKSRGAPYVCSPLLAEGLLYVHDEQGVLNCWDAGTGELVYTRRLAGKFYASGVAGDGKLYLTNESGETYVIRLGREYELLSKNSLGEECLASPAICGGRLFLRTKGGVYCVGK